MLPDKDPSPPDDASSGTHRLFAWFPAGFNLECPLLEALPFPKGVSSNLKELERLVAVAVDVEHRPTCAPRPFRAFDSSSGIAAWAKAKFFASDFVCCHG